MGQEGFWAVWVFIGAAGGLALGWWLASGRESRNSAAAQVLEKELRSNLAAAQRRLDELQLELTAALAAQKAAEIQAAETHKRLAEERELLAQAQARLTDTFKSLAADILEEKSRRFAEQNRSGLQQLLEPLGRNIEEFKSKVEQVYVEGVRERSSLREQVKQLTELNQQLSEEAGNLTRALRGSAKAQGTWGELILERVLEAAGLRKGQEYDMQERYQNEEGRIGQPDVVVHLPEDRHLIIDSKVSLKAYEEYANAESEAARADALKRHVQSIRTHISGLSKRNYQSLNHLPSLDFVVMFVPIEPALGAALAVEPKLWLDAWDKDVLLIGPGALLFVLRTVANLWRQEQQARSVQDIVERGAAMYNKLAAFVADLDELGGRLRQAQHSYDDAYSKLTTGAGNVIRQAEMLKDLGVKPAKKLPQGLVERAAQLEIEGPAAMSEAAGKG
ncbi:MAG: DNA recombination protein RmuC [Acidobacteria bacterium]|nr:DNA recombination protein RmuC [Acidobacteriota bacterium]